MMAVYILLLGRLAAKIRNKAHIAVYHTARYLKLAIAELSHANSGLGPVVLLLAVKVSAMTYHELGEAETRSRNRLYLQRLAADGGLAG